MRGGVIGAGRAREGLGDGWAESWPRVTRCVGERGVGASERRNRAAVVEGDADRRARGGSERGGADESLGRQRGGSGRTLGRQRGAGPRCARAAQAEREEEGAGRADGKRKKERERRIRPRAKF